MGPAATAHFMGNFDFRVSIGIRAGGPFACAGQHAWSNRKQVPANDDGTAQITILLLVHADKEEGKQNGSAAACSGVEGDKAITQWSDIILSAVAAAGLHATVTLIKFCRTCGVGALAGRWRAPWS